MTETIDLARRDGVELIRTGSWPAMTGSWQPKREDLAAAIEALKCPAVRRPVLKVGHLDSRFTAAKAGDGEPAIGWVDNLRLGDGGHTLVGDYVGMPAWIGQIMASAWPDRSIEGDYNYRCTLSHTHPFALKAVALLGVVPPAVGTLRSLQDVATLYGVNVAAADMGTGEHVQVIIRAAAEVHTGAMVALIPTPDDATRLAVAGGEPADQLHVTLAYLGGAADLGAQGQQDIIDAVSSAANGLPVIDAIAFALSVFNPGAANDRDPCIVLGLSGDLLDAVHDLIGHALADAPIPGQMRPFAAHMTLQYTDDLARLAGLTDRIGPVRFDRLRIAFAGQTVDIPLIAPPGDHADAVSAAHGRYEAAVRALRDRTVRAGRHSYFDPGQERDGDGKWTDEAGSHHSPDARPEPSAAGFAVLNPDGAVIARQVGVSGGTLEMVAAGDGSLKLGFRSATGDKVSASLGSNVAKRLADLIDAHTSGDGGKQVEAWPLKVSNPGDPHGDLVERANLSTSDGGKNLELRLNGSEAALTFTAAEGRTLVSELQQASLARRLHGEFGQLDVSLQDEKFVFAMFDGDGKPTKVEFDGPSWAGISTAIDTVWQGFVEDADSDDTSDITVRHVTTDAGNVRVQRFGPPEDFDRITVTPEGDPDGWAIYISGADYRANARGGDFIRYLADLQFTAEEMGFYSPMKAAKVTAAAREGAKPMSRAQQIRDAWNTSGAPITQWVQEARHDAAVVVDDADRSYRLVPVFFDGDTVSFGEPTSYDPEVDRPLVFASRAESRPDTPPAAVTPPAEQAPPELPAAEPEQEMITDPKEDPVSTDLSAFRSRLGLDDTADEAALLAAYDAALTKAETPVEPTPEMVAASAATEAEKDELRKEVQVLASRMEQVTTELAATKAEKSATVKASVLDEAQRLGKFTPAEREAWETDYDQAPAAVTRVLASIAVGTAVPVMASGTIGAPEPSGSDAEWDEIVARLDAPKGA